MLKRSAMVMGCLLMTLMVVGCSNDDKPNKSSNEAIPSTLIATWTFQSATVGGIPVELRSILGWQPATTSARISISTTGTCVYEEMDAQSLVVLTDSADFSVAGDGFAVTPGTLPVDSGNWLVTGDQLSLSADVHGYRFEIMAIKLV